MNFLFNSPSYFLSRNKQRIRTKNQFPTLILSGNSHHRFSCLLPHSCQALLSLFPSWFVAGASAAAAVAMVFLPSPSSAATTSTTPSSGASVTAGQGRGTKQQQRATGALLLPSRLGMLVLYAPALVAALADTPRTPAPPPRPSFLQVSYKAAPPPLQVAPPCCSRWPPPSAAPALSYQVRILSPLISMPWRRSALIEW